jgi:gentisate 1,2-dioxygenase
MSTSPDDVASFHRELERQHLVALWEVSEQLLSLEPRSRVLPHAWRWKHVLPLLHGAGALTSLSRDAERRVLGLINPGLPGRHGATATLWAGLQYLLPGEVAPAHRHSLAAIRFIVQGEGAFTTVNGDKCLMARGDLILTPPWAWHDHGHSGAEPVIWFDGVDLPLVTGLEAIFVEPFAADAQPLQRPVGDSSLRYGAGPLRPTFETPTGTSSPLLHYKWEPTLEALRRLATVGACPFDDVCMEYIHPHTGGPLMPTMACDIQLLRAQVHTRAHRHTGSTVYLVHEGKGFSVIDGQRFDWSRGDIFVVPPWAWHEHASVDGEALLFSVKDRPVMQSLGLWREQAYPDGHQPITRTFEG